MAPSQRIEQQLARELRHGRSPAIDVWVAAMDCETEIGGAERASRALRAEVATPHQAIAGQSAPDYALTLVAIVKQLQVVGLEAIAADLEREPAED